MLFEPCRRDRGLCDRGGPCKLTQHINIVRHGKRSSAVNDRDALEFEIKSCTSYKMFSLSLLFAYLPWHAADSPL